MAQEDLELEQRLARFEAQLDRFSLTLREWQHARDDPAQAADSLDVDRRIRALEETFDREARALRRLHEQPLKQLQAQTANLSEICIAATNSVNSLDQAEARLAALHTDLHLHLTDLSRNFQALANDLRNAVPSTVTAGGPGASWPLERVVHVHDELRRATGSRNGAAPHASGMDLRSAASEAHLDGTPDAHETPSTPPGRRWWRYGAAAAALIAVVAIGLAVERGLEARLDDAAARVTAAEQHAETTTHLANEQITSARAEADRQIGDARKSAQRAETIGAVLTAPDLVRFALTGGSPERRLSAQVLWSRTRGLVLSASRLPVAPPDTNYQVWLWANGEPVSAGVFVPDANGRVTLVNDAPPKVSGPVANIEVTVEPSGGRATPSGRTLLARLQ